MYIHIAIFKWKPEADIIKVEQALDGIKNLENKVEGLTRINWGHNESKYSEGYSHVVFVEGVSKEAIEAYRKHPDHVVLGKEIESYEEKGIGVDFTPE